LCRYCRLTDASVVTNFRLVLCLSAAVAAAAADDDDNDDVDADDNWVHAVPHELTRRLIRSDSTATRADLTARRSPSCKDCQFKLTVTAQGRI